MDTQALIPQGIEGAPTKHNLNPVLTGLLSTVIIEPDEIATDKLSLPYAAKFVWWGSHSGRVFCAL